jgi:hypothetical protein
MSSEASDHDNSPPKPPEGVREWLHSWRYLFLVIGLAGLVLLFYQEENWRGSRAWEKYKQQMIAKGERFDPAAFIPPRVADDDNFAMTPALAPMFEFIPGTQRWANSNGPALFSDLKAKYVAAAEQIKSSSEARVNSWIPGRTDLGAWATAFSAPTNHRHHKKALAPVTLTSSETASRVLAGVADLDPVLDELRMASKRPKSRFNLRYEQENPAEILLPHLAQLKSLCQVLQLRACAELASGRTADALNDIDLMFYLIDATRDEPILITHLVRMAELQLAFQPLAEGMGSWSEPQLLALQTRLQLFDFCSDVKRALEAERTLFGGGIFDYIRRSSNRARLIEQFERSGPGNDYGNDSLWPVAPLLVAAPTGWFYLEQLNLSREFDQYLLPLIDLNNRLIKPEAAQSAETHSADLNAGSPVSRFLHHRLFAGMLLPAVSKISQKAAYGQTAADTAVLACALERYRLEHGQLPDSLEKLAPQFITALPHDLITGKPLIYRPNSDGHYLLYSVGWNEKDDGGIPGKNKNAEAEHPDGDWVWTDNF